MFSPVSSLWKSFERARLCEHCLNEPDLLALMPRFVLDFQKFVLATSMSPKLKGRLFWFDVEIVMDSWIETSVLSDIVALMSNCRVLVDFQSSNVPISKSSCLRELEFRFDVQIVTLDHSYVFSFRIVHVAAVSYFLQVGVLIAFDIFVRLVSLEVLQTGKTARALLG
jgi:hypothetical protein